MRITERMMTENAIRHMAENKERLQQLQEKVASAKQFQSASENPGGASLALSLRSSINIGQSYLETAQSTYDWMEASEGAFKQMVEVADRALMLITRGLSDTFGDDEIEVMGEEVGALLDRAVSIGNTSHAGNYLFSGFQINTPPFELIDANTVEYHGDQGKMQRDIGRGQTMTANVTGDAAFMDVFNALIQARNAFAAKDKEALRESMGALNAANTEMNKIRAVNGAHQRQVQTTIEHIEKTQIELKAFLSQREDANMVEAIAMLRNQEITYQAVLEVGQRAIAALNLFEVLR